MIINTNTDGSRTIETTDGDYIIIVAVIIALLLLFAVKPCYMDDSRHYTERMTTCVTNGGTWLNGMCVSRCEGEEQ